MESRQCYGTQDPLLESSEKPVAPLPIQVCLASTVWQIAWQSHPCCFCARWGFKAREMAHSLSEVIRVEQLNKTGRRDVLYPWPQLACRGCYDLNHLPPGSAHHVDDDDHDNNDKCKAFYGQYFVYINLLDPFTDKNNTLLYIST